MNPEEPHNTNRRSHYVLLFFLFLFVLAHLNHHILSALLTPLLPFIRDEFNLNYTQVGLLVSAFTIAYGISHLPSGWLSDRIGPRKLIIISIFGGALFGLLVGLSPNYIIMVVSLISMGIFGGGYHPTAAPLISSSFESKYRGRVLGIHQIGGTASFFLAPLLAISIASYLNWRGSFITISIFTIIFGIIFFIELVRQRYKIDNSKHAHSIIKSSIERSKHHFLISFILLGVVIQVLIFSSLTYIPLYTVDNLGGSEKTAAIFLSLAHSSGLWAGPLSGYLSDRWSRTKILLIIGLVSGPLILLLNYTSIGPSIILLMILLGMCQYLVMPLTEVHIISEASEKRRSTIIGIYYFASRGGPGILIPIMGLLIDNIGFYITYSSIGFVMIIIAVTCTTFLSRN